MCIWLSENLSSDPPQRKECLQYIMTSQNPPPPPKMYNYMIYCHRKVPNFYIDISKSRYKDFSFNLNTPFFFLYYTTIHLLFAEGFIPKGKLLLVACKLSVTSLVTCGFPFAHEQLYRQLLFCRSDQY